MLNILTWLCSISICFLCIQIFGYMCKDVIRNFNQIKNANTISKENQAVSKSSADYVEKIAK